MEEIILKTESITRSLIYTGCSLQDIGSELDKKDIGKKVLILSDSRVSRLYGELVENSIKEAGREPINVTLPQGEDTKNITRLLEIIEVMARNTMSRDDAIVALGGGVISDIGGFAASIYMRGIHFIAAPTTLLGQVDAAIGGKTAVNLAYGKNLAGSFYQPVFVYADQSTLLTLSEKEKKQGLAEVIKYGVIAGSKILDILRKTDISGLEGYYDFLVPESIKIKKAVVEKDEKETRGMRDVLNFGHTIGHAVEFSSPGQYTHGEAVAVGMVCEAFISYKTGLSSMDTYIQIRDIVAGFKLPYTFSATDTDKVLKFIDYDKKTRKGLLQFALPEEIGRMKCRVAISKKDVGLLLKEIMRNEES